ncbi:MAG: linear amide C-N hydrolase [Alistipes sp.]|nr:linear amide C-N hydrolase [Alistipes sp.]
MKIKIAIFCALGLICSMSARPCSRVVLQGGDSLVVVGRTLDWRTPIPTNLYVYPRGMKKQGMPSGNTYHWTSKYGSVLAVSYDGGVTEGMNERGLVMNALFCKGSVYRTSPDGKLPGLSLAVFISYFLDNFATVDEVAKWVAANQFAIYGESFDQGTASLLHWAVTDRTGKTFIMEFQDGKLYTYLSPDYRVLTNDPPFNQMLAINNYWTQVGGENMLPGTVRSSDRFVRASFFIEHVPSDVDATRAAVEVFSVLDNVSVPLGYELDGAPNLSSTQWKSVADSRNLLYYFTFTTQFGKFWIDLGSLNLKAGAPVLKLDTSKQTNMFGNVNSLLQRSNPFTPMW